METTMTGYVKPHQVHQLALDVTSQIMDWYMEKYGEEEVPEEFLTDLFANALANLGFHGDYQPKDYATIVARSVVKKLAAMHNWPKGDEFFTRTIDLSLK